MDVQKLHKQDTATSWHNMAVRDLKKGGATAAKQLFKAPGLTTLGGPRWAASSLQISGLDVDRAQSKHFQVQRGPRPAWKISGLDPDRVQPGFVWAQRKPRPA